MLYFWMVGVVSMFSETPHNPFGIPMVREGFIVLSVLYLPLFYAQRPRDKTSTLVLLVPPLAAAYSALMATFTFGQPFFAGFIEERRILQMWIFFPLVVHAKSFDHLMTVFLRVSVVAATMGLLNLFGLLPGWHAYEISAIDGRVGRANFSTNAVLIAALVCAEKLLRSKGSRMDLGAVILCLSFLLLVAQTRQIVLAFLLVVFARLIFASGRPVLKFVTLFSIATLFIYVMFENSAVNSQSFTKYAELFDFGELARSARGSTIVSIFNDLTVFGSGALSLGWRGGFSEIYGGNFYLADVGLFGTFFRFGVLFAPLVIAITVYFLWAAQNRVATPFQKVMVLTASMGLLILLPTGAVFEQKSYLLGFVVALGSAGHLFQRPLQFRFRVT